ncbi:MAG TPA: CHASE3 domain-containing protein, partial [Methylophilaceae bacterium]|nr:CHASE3 domain-containing protein [Methylophilaceae bacterium]
MKQLLGQLYQWCKEAVHRIGLRVVLVLGGYIILAVLAVALTNGWLNRLAALNTQIGQAKDTLVTLEQLRTGLMQAESIQRGFLITARPGYIAPYDDAIKQVEASLDKLETQLQPAGSADHARFDELLKSITADIEGKVTEMQMLLSLARDGNTEGAVKVINTDEGLVKMANFFNDTSALNTALNEDVERLSQSRDRIMLAGRASVWASILLVLILVV